MFWGLIMEPQRRYTQKVKKPFHISMASLDISTSSEEPAQVMCAIEGRNYLLCTLRKPDVMQCPLDLNFEVGNELSFAANGQCHVHLTGYLIDEFPSDDLEEESEEEEVEKPVKKKKKNNKNLANGPPTKKLKANNVDEDDNSDDNSDDSVVSVEDLFQKSFDEDDENDDTYMEEDESEEAEEEEDDDAEVEEEEELSSMSESENEEDGEEDEEPVNSVKKSKKASKLNGISPKEHSSPLPKKDKKQKQAEEKKTPAKDGKTPNKEVKTPNKESKSPKEAKKKTLQGGVVIHDIKEGQGPIAKPGKFVTVYYEGRLKQNNKMFDSTTKGSGFSFRLGGGEVIKGWDVGVAGMRIGGKRKIICPPAMAYGAKGSPPAIPENSTLVFEVELKKMR